MNIKAVVLADLVTDLTDSLDKRLALDIADCAADFRDDNVRVGFLADRLDKALDFVRNVRNNLNGLAEVFAASLLGEHV